MFFFGRRLLNVVPPCFACIVGFWVGVMKDEWYFSSLMESGAALDDGGSPRVKPTLLFQHYERFALQKVGEFESRCW